MTRPGNNAAAAPRPFGMRDRIGYMFGDFGNDFTFILQAMFFTLFYTNVIGIDPIHVGILLLVARVVDGFTDVGMGVLVDRLPLKEGADKFRRWIKWIAIPVAVASTLMYMSFVADFTSYTAKIVWMCATYFLWGSICYTAINIPYGSMASVISADPNHRAQLSVWRSTGANLAVLLISSVLPLVVYTKNAEGVAVLDGSMMTYSAIFCSVAAVICYAVLYVFSVERVKSQPNAEGAGAQKQPSIGKMLVSVVSNKALLGLIVAALLLLLANLFLTGMLGYLFLNWFGNGKLQSPASMAGMLPAFVLIVLAPWLAKRFGKAEVGAIAMLVGGVVLVAAYFLKIENAMLWIVFYSVAMFCIAIFNFLVWAFITDVIDDQEVRTGNRDDATVYAVYSWARKLGQALAGFLTTWALSFVGFDSAIAKEGGQQAQSVIDGIYTFGNLVPGVGCILVGLALMFLYPLKKKRVVENEKILEARRAEKAAAHA
ncbi:MFS transporter [Arcanobacterium hippocoleae]|uniref:GPH family glycoside/pentoside/hexuronide:cation symporter n=1 Tax=Arcanobacterium hippocoleae TaxID=149017 RepID=A0ABU1T3N7_9ACTO|nr:glycoside-pentoside-hexuronide (GPH):cation symporter [Arcanobacterium hippocoleae]MDR6939928.1 GPH family glycoside/pentoside/hexuronide:cation symporter [Arcanobacterium hippocoleae]